MYPAAVEARAPAHTNMPLDKEYKDIFAPYHAYISCCIYSETRAQCTPGVDQVQGVHVHMNNITVERSIVKQQIGN
jgi:hypothetical protein